MNEIHKSMKNIYICALAGLLLLGFSGCKKLDNFGDTNSDPSTPSKPVLANLMTNAGATLGGISSSGSIVTLNNLAITGMITPALYGQYFSESQYNDVSLYSLQQASFTPFYSTVLYDLQKIIITNESNNMTQVAKIMQQYIFWTITDRWGDVPYSQALQGLANLKPKYDKQEDIYKGMISTLTAAIAAMDGSAITGDIINNGDVAAWKRTANSLRMLMSLQLSKKYPGATDYAATQFKAAMADAGGYITSNDENFTLEYPGENFPNPWWSTYNGRKDYGESKTMTDLTASLGDTRQTAFGGLTESSTSVNATVTSNVGLPFGVSRADIVAFTSANPGWARVLRGDFRTQTSPVIIISAAEVTLARAEAADRLWTTESVATVYAQGIALSFGQWGVTMPASYLTQAAVALSGAGTATNLQKIVTQEYIASYPNGFRAWNLWRRTGYPVLTPAPAATNASKAIPRRLAYAITEYTSNAEAIAAAVASLPGGDTQDARVWWDQ